MKASLMTVVLLGLASIHPAMAAQAAKDWGVSLTKSAPKKIHSVSAQRFEKAFAYQPFHRRSVFESATEVRQRRRNRHYC